MENNMKKIELHQLAAILFGLLAGYHFYSLIINLAGVGILFLFTGVLLAAGYGITAYCIYKGRRDMLLVAGFGLLAAVSLIEFFIGFKYGFYSVDSWYGGLRFSFFAFLPALIDLAGYVVAFLVAAALLTDYLPQFKDLAKKLWFVPSVLIIATFIVALFVQILYGIGLLSGWWYYARVYIGFVNLIGRLIVAAAFFLGLTWAAFPGGISENPFASRKDAEGNVHYEIPVEDAAYCGLFKHTLLLLLTFGIWNLIWIYRRTAYLNRVEEEPKQTPLYQLLLCMFVPFYLIYWTYRNAQRLEKFAQSKGVNCEISLLCLIASLTGSLIPAILMQEKLNEAIVGKIEHVIDPTQEGLSEKASVGLVKHTLLYMLTFGIWNFIWIYRTTRELNKINEEPERNPVTKLLLCMFVPFYMIYWYYVSAQRIDKLASARGIKSELATWTLILSIFASIVPAILMQEKMNKLVVGDVVPTVQSRDIEENTEI